jgi:hypothetical protein
MDELAKSSKNKNIRDMYVGVLISFWLFLFPIFLFAAQTK